MEMNFTLFKGLKIEYVMTCETFMKIKVYWNPDKISMAAFVSQWALLHVKPAVFTLWPFIEKLANP